MEWCDQYTVGEVCKPANILCMYVYLYLTLQSVYQL